MRLTRPSVAKASAMPNTAPSAAMTTPSIATDSSSVRREMPRSRRMPTVSRRSSARITISASRNAVPPAIVTAEIAM